MEILTQFGADAKATVQKLKRFRENDEEKRKLELVKNSKDEAVVKAAIEERAKKREEVLKERIAAE